MPRSVEAEAARRGLDVVNAACPLVLKVHNEGRRYAEKGYDVVLIGHADHPEVKGTVGQIDGPLHVVATVEEVAALDVADPEKVAYVTQTTLSLDDTQDVIEALKARFPAVVGPGTNDICYATQNRQRAVRDLAGDVDLIVVMGAANSSNSNRLREIEAMTAADLQRFDAQQGTNLAGDYRRATEGLYGEYAQTVARINESDMDADVKAAQIAETQSLYTSRQAHLNTVYTNQPKWNDEWAQFELEFGRP